ncbi:hypothetical protein LX12_001746 [Williamsia serinedens]|uniref:Uncharacterized protein n=1 Tax=Williamsia serinedens TaxID=391736 RepID=A0ABT1GZY4_9NOCA|nr:hypothetical protein [Williamsia serinedens]
MSRGRRAGRLSTDFTIRAVIAIGYDLGMVESTYLRIDDTRPGLTLTHPEPGKVYASSYGTPPDLRRGPGRH